MDQEFYNNLITTDVHSYIFFNLWMHECISAFFEFNWNSSAENYLKRTWNWRMKNLDKF